MTPIKLTRITVLQVPASMKKTPGRTRSQLRMPELLLRSQREKSQKITRKETKMSSKD
jgi:hypothetical protein